MSTFRKKGSPNALSSVLGSHGIWLTHSSRWALTRLTVRSHLTNSANRSVTRAYHSSIQTTSEHACARRCQLSTLPTHHLKQLRSRTRRFHLASRLEITVSIPLSSRSCSHGAQNLLTIRSFRSTGSPISDGVLLLEHCCGRRATLRSSSEYINFLLRKTSSSRCYLSHCKVVRTLVICFRRVASMLACRSSQ